jgi:hypothetical protein
MKKQNKNCFFIFSCSYDKGAYLSNLSHILSGMPRASYFQEIKIETDLVVKSGREKK